MAVPSGAIAARRVAALVVERFDLAPPVDVEALLRERAALTRADWPVQTVDAVMTGLGRANRPNIYYRATDNLLRERFTLGHELGHILLPWHLPEQNCSIGTGTLDLPRYSPEDEADVFSSCILMPDSWLLKLVRKYDMTEVVRQLNTAEVTTYAGLLALRRVLLAGWVFVSYGADRVVVTPGTHINGLDVRPRDLSIAQLTKNSYERGDVLLNGHKVRWFRLSKPSDLPTRDPKDGRSLSQLLQDAVAMVVRENSERTHLVQVCNGKIGGALREATGRPAAEAYESLVHRFESSELGPLLDQADFRVWLSEKATAIENRNTKRRRQRSRDTP